MSMPIVNAAQIALSMKHDGTSSLCGKIAEAAVLLDSIETEIVDRRLDGWAEMPNDWETVCERIAEYMSDGPVMPARQPDREVILGFINQSEGQVSRRKAGLRLLDVPVGRKQWDPKAKELLGLLRKEIEKPAADSGTKKGKE